MRLLTASSFQPASKNLINMDHGFSKVDTVKAQGWHQGLEAENSGSVSQLDWGLQNKSRSLPWPSSNSPKPCQASLCCSKKGVTLVLYLSKETHETQHWVSAVCLHKRTSPWGFGIRASLFHWVVWGVPKRHRVETIVDIARKVYGP